MPPGVSTPGEGWLVQPLPNLLHQHQAQDISLQQGVLSNGLPDAVEFRQGAQLYVGCDQGPTAVESGGADDVIGWIAALKHGTAR